MYSNMKFRENKNDVSELENRSDFIQEKVFPVVETSGECCLYPGNTPQSLHPVLIRLQVSQPSGTSNQYRYPGVKKNNCNGFQS